MGRYLPLVLLVTACTTRVAHFKPTERVRAEPGRPPAATYAMHSSDGAVGTTRLWSNGVYIVKGRNVAHVAIELESAGNSAMSIDVRMLRLKARNGDEQSPDLEVAAIVGPTAVPPRGYGRVDTFFVLPADMKPKAVSELAVQWEARIGDQKQDEVTTFEPTMNKSRKAALFYGARLPGTMTSSPTGAWYTCPDQPNEFYTSPPDC